MERNVRGQLAGLLSAFDDILALDDPDAILRRSVEAACTRFGLTRAAIFLYDGTRDMMLGTWGTDLQGAIVDEHQIMYSLSDVDREAFRRAKEEGAHFTVFDDCPIVEHHGSETRVAGRGWVTWTPILSPRGIIGVLFNDVGLSRAPVDETKQAHAAILCTLLGTILDPLRGMPGAGKGVGRDPGATHRNGRCRDGGRRPDGGKAGNRPPARDELWAGSPAPSRRRWGCPCSSTAIESGWITSMRCSDKAARRCSRRHALPASAVTPSSTGSLAKSAT